MTVLLLQVVQLAFLFPCKSWRRGGDTILAETTFSSLSEEDLKIANSIKGYVLDQYWFTPLFFLIWKSLSYIGDVNSVCLSSLRKHHAASICRRIFDSSEIIGSKILLEHDSAIIASGSRYGLLKTNDSLNCKRTIKMVEFSDKRVFINDFTFGQYHSYITPSRVEIRGARGVITERDTTYINISGYPIGISFVFHRDSDHYN